MVSTEWREILSVYILSGPISWHNISLLVSAVPTARLQEKQDCPEQHAINGIFCTKNQDVRSAALVEEGVERRVSHLVSLCALAWFRKQRKKRKKKQKQKNIKWSTNKNNLGGGAKDISDGCRVPFIR